MVREGGVVSAFRKVGELFLKDFLVFLLLTFACLSLFEPAG